MLRLFAFAAMLWRVHSLLANGSAFVPANRMVFLHKFCFDYSPDGTHVGRWSVNLKSSTPGDLELVYFDDETTSVPDSSHINWNFQCGSASLKQATRSFVHVEGNQLQIRGGFQLNDMSIVERVRPRWWYMAVLDCSGYDRELDFSVHTLNLKQGWQMELSMDQCGLVTIGLFCGLYVALLSGHVYSVSLDGNVNVKHPLRVCLTLALAAAVVGALLQFSSGLNSVWHGVQAAPLYVTSKLSKWMSKLLLTCAIMLISRGHAISHPLRKQHLLRVFQLLAPLFTGSVALELAGEYAQSQTYSTDSSFCSRYGVLLICFDVFLLLTYMRSLCRSHAAESDEVKRKFYAVWGPCYAAAFGILPVATIVAYFVDPWVRVRVIFILTNSVHVSLLGVLSLSLRPEKTLPAFCIDAEELVETYGQKSDLLPSLLYTTPPDLMMIQKPQLRGDAQAEV